jgi:hypothetical protein
MYINCARAERLRFTGHKAADYPDFSHFAFVIDDYRQVEMVKAPLNQS